MAPPLFLYGRDQRSAGTGACTAKAAVARVSGIAGLTSGCSGRRLTWRSTERFRGAAELRAVSPTNRGISENSLMDALAATGLLRTGWRAGVA